MTDGTAEILDEIRVREKNEITIPPRVREYLNLSPGDYVRFELSDNTVCIHKAVTRKISNTYGGVDANRAKNSC